MKIISTCTLLLCGCVSAMSPGIGDSDFNETESALSSGEYRRILQELQSAPSESSPILNPQRAYAPYAPFTRCPNLLCSGVAHFAPPHSAREEQSQLDSLMESIEATLSDSDTQDTASTDADTIEPTANASTSGVAVDASTSGLNPNAAPFVPRNLRKNAAMSTAPSAIEPVQKATSYTQPAAFEPAHKQRARYQQAPTLLECALKFEKSPSTLHTIEEWCSGMEQILRGNIYLPPQWALRFSIALLRHYMALKHGRRFLSEAEYEVMTRAVNCIRCIPIRDASSEIRYNVAFVQYIVLKK